VPKIRILAIAALVSVWLVPSLSNNLLFAQDAVSPVGLENLILRYRIYKNTVLPDAERQSLLDGIEKYVQQHLFWQKMRVVGMEHEYEIWFTRGRFEWQWQVDDSPVTLLRVGGAWSFQGEKMAMNVDDGNCLMAAIEFPEFSIHRTNAFTPATVKIVDFDIIDCADFAPGEGEHRMPDLPGYVGHNTWIAEALGVSIAGKYGTDNINSLAEIFAEIPLDQPLL
jgi:hypothetical protein